MSGEHIRGIPRTYEKEITLADTPYTLSLGYNCVKVDTTGGNVRVNLPDVNYPIDVIKTSSDAYIVTIWVGGTQIGEVAGELSVVTIENAEVTVDEPWYPYDAIVGIAGVSGDGGEVLAKDRYGRVIAGGRGVAGTDDVTVSQTVLDDGDYKDILFAKGTFTFSSTLCVPAGCRIHGHWIDTVLKLANGAVTTVGVPLIKIDPYLGRGQQNVSISDICIDGNKDNQTINTDNKGQATVGIWIIPSTVDSVHIGYDLHNIVAKNCASGAIYLEAGAIGRPLHANLNNLLLYNNGKLGQTYSAKRGGLHLDTAESVNASNIISRNNVGYGFGITNSKYVSLASCQSYNNGVGLYVGAAAGYVTKDINVDVIINGGDPGTDIFGVDAYSLQDININAKIYNALGAGIRAFSMKRASITALVDTVASGTGSSGNGIEIQQSIGIDIDAESTACSNYGAYLRDLDQSKIRLNSKSNQMCGMLLYDSDDNIVANSHFIDNSRIGNNLHADVRLSGYRNYFSDCKFISSDAIKTSKSIVEEETVDYTRIRNCGLLSGNAVSSFISAHLSIKDCLGYDTENSGSSTGTGSEQTIAHGLAAIPTGCKAWITYLVGGRYVTEMVPFDATNIYPTVDNGVAYTWRIE